VQRFVVLNRCTLAPKRLGDTPQADDWRRQGHVMAETATPSPPNDHPRIPGPTYAAWREQALTRAAELRSRVCELDLERDHAEQVAHIERHITAATEAAHGAWPEHKHLLWPRTLIAWMRGASVERADSELDAAEAALLRIAPPAYVIGQLPAILTRACMHLPPTDPRLQRLAQLALIYGDCTLADETPASGNGHGGGTIP
jgi:hypothetical protein